jgi:hypothetical protein
MSCRRKVAISLLIDAYDGAGGRIARCDDDDG